MSSEGSRKRKRQDWKNLPAFLDASASVSATMFGARRFPETKALWNAVQQRSSSPGTRGRQEYQSSGGKTSSRHLRRRTTSHMPRRRNRNPRGKTTKEQSQQQPDSNERPCRRARRKPALLRKQHGAWQSETFDSSNTEEYVVNWLTTHLWHAKRFHMHDNMFGWKVPLVHANRGGRAALRMASEHHTLIQDATWRSQPIIIGSSNLKTLISSFQRMSPDLLLADQAKAVLSGSCFGQGMLHEPDKFPTAAIGPAMWLMADEPLDSTGAVDTGRKRMWWIHIFVHPAIRTIVRELFSGMSKEVSLLEEPRDLQGGLVCFQLRGKSATASIKQALGPSCCRLAANDTSTVTFDWDKASSRDDLHTQVPHLTVVPVQVSLHGSHVSEESTRENDTADSGLTYIDSYSESVQQWDPSMPRSSPRTGDGRVVLVAQCPCNSSLTQNEAVCGWDILCHPSDAAAIFQALTVKGNARAIGVVEESLACLESEPPLSVFPRDYPATKAGRSYWNGDSGDWQLLRQSLEQGWGRINLPQAKQLSGEDDKLSLPAVTWSHISTLPEDASNSGAEVVVVRRDFGKPFVDALVGCGHLPRVAPPGVSKSRRPRRRVRPSSASVQLIRLTNDEAVAHQDVCEDLLDSLSLSALVRCHIKLEGKGTIVAGARILASICDEEEQTGYIDYLLGIAVAGAFSMSRGLVHGVGFVGAARLLHVLSSDHGRLSCVMVKRPEGTRQVELKVTIKASTRGDVERKATISLLL